MGGLSNRWPWPTHAATHRAIFDYIEGWYNTRRRHSSLGYLSPARAASAIAGARPPHDTRFASSKTA